MEMLFIVSGEKTVMSIAASKKMKIFSTYLICWKLPSNGWGFCTFFIYL